MERGATNDRGGGTKLLEPPPLSTLTVTFQLTGPLGIAFGNNEIEEIIEGGLAHTEGSLQVGDRLVSLNDQTVDTSKMLIGEMLQGATEARCVVHRPAASQPLGASAAVSAREGVAQWLAEAETPADEEGDGDVSEVLRT